MSLEVRHCPIVEDFATALNLHVAVDAVDRHTGPLAHVWTRSTPSIRHASHPSVDDPWPWATEGTAAPSAEAPGHALFVENVWQL